jgi:alpha-1,2-mannosyltransferase
MAAASFTAVPLTLWVTFGQLGWAPVQRWAGVLAVGAVGIWTVPVLVSLQQGQIELVLMALVAWDLCQPDRRRWKGAGVGIAAGIKLVPMIFILYLLLAGKLRQAAVAAAALAGTVLIGFAALPHESARWWLTGYFLHSGNFTRLELGSLVNQSLLAVLVDTAVRARGPARLACWLLAAALAAVFVAWPAQVTGPRAFLPYGLVGFGSGSHPLTEIFRLHGLQLISWNLFVLAGLVMLAFLVAWAAARRPSGRLPA